MPNTTDHNIHREDEAQDQVMLSFKNLWPKMQQLQDKRRQRATDIRSGLTLSWLLQPGLKVHMASLGNTYSHHSLQNIEGKSVYQSSSDTSKTWLWATELHYGSANAFLTSDWDRNT